MRAVNCPECRQLVTVGQASNSNLIDPHVDLTAGTRCPASDTRCDGLTEMFLGVPDGPVLGVVAPPEVSGLGPGEEDLRTWWMGQSERDLAMLLPKVGEYSAYDLELIGRVTADTLGWGGPRDAATLTEIGIAFYLLGKIGRIMGAIREGNLPSRDSWLDSHVYAKMALRTRDAGGWPSGHVQERAPKSPGEHQGGEAR